MHYELSIEKMEKKKTPSADLESKRAIFFQFGLVIALLMAVLAVNFESHKPKMMEVTVKVTGLEVTPDSTSVARPPEISR